MDQEHLRKVFKKEADSILIPGSMAELAGTWIAKLKNFLINWDLGEHFDSVKVLNKKHIDFEKSLAAQEEMIKALDEIAKFIKGQHYAAKTWFEDAHCY